MSVVKLLKTVRLHWKKSVFAVSLGAYGVSFAGEKYKINCLMKFACAEAVNYGNSSIQSLTPCRKVVVILNPVARKRTAVDIFEKYCSPILQLAGYTIDVIKSDSEGHVRRYVEDLPILPDAIIVAGGDGTLSEAITGMLRRPGADKCPIGILPIRQSHSSMIKIDQVKCMTTAALSILRGEIELKDVMKIEPIISEYLQEKTGNENHSNKPIYAYNTVQWGAYRDALALGDNYWYFGPLRDYVSMVFNSFSNELTWNCSSKLIYSSPCNGCSYCYKIQRKVEPKRRWWSLLVPSFKQKEDVAPSIDYSKIVNEKCSKKVIREMNSSEILFTTDNNSSALLNTNDKTKFNNKLSKISVRFGKDSYSSYGFIRDSFSRLYSNDIVSNEEIHVRTIEIHPQTITTDKNLRFYSIDNEAYEVKPIRITLLPAIVPIYS